MAVGFRSRCARSRALVCLARCLMSVGSRTLEPPASCPRPPSPGASGLRRLGLSHVCVIVLLLGLVFPKGECARDDNRSCFSPPCQK